MLILESAGKRSASVQPLSLQVMQQGVPTWVLKILDSTHSLATPDAPFCTDNCWPPVQNHYTKETGGFRDACTVYCARNGHAEEGVYQEQFSRYMSFRCDLQFNLVQIVLDNARGFTCCVSEIQDTRMLDGFCLYLTSELMNAQCYPANVHPHNDA